MSVASDYSSVACARAFPNIALIKYWGKCDERLMLPFTDSVSMTLDIFPTTTSVEFTSAGDDRLVLDGAEIRGAPLDRVRRFLDIVRERAGDIRHALVRTRNTVPTGAGLASSAAGFAALALAASAAWRLPLDETSVSRLARRGSGSATRSVIPGLAVWHAGHDDESSSAEPIVGPRLAMVVAVVDASRKKMSSREAMRRTVATSPYFDGWVSSTRRMTGEMLDACRRGDVRRIGELAEMNALRMHAVIEASDPPIRYLSAGSVAVLDRVTALRDAGVDVWATADAGPNVVAICDPSEVGRVVEGLKGLARLHVAHPGPGASLVPAAESAAEVVGA